MICTSSRPEKANKNVKANNQFIPFFDQIHFSIGVH